MGRNWNDDIVYFLINEVKQCPFMWDHQCSKYKNVLKKKKFWERTTRRLNNRFAPSIPFLDADVSKKWNNLKSYYKSEYCKILKAKANGATQDELNEITIDWKYSKVMEFVVAGAAEAPTGNNLNVRNDLFSDPLNDDPTDIVVNNNNINNAYEETMDSTASVESSLLMPKRELEDSSEISEHSSRKKMRLEEPLKKICGAFNKLAEVCIKRQLADNAPNAAFGRFIVEELNNLSTPLQIEAKSKICQLIFQLQLHQLNEDNELSS